MDRLTNFLFTPFWTAGVTVTAVAAARLWRREHYVLAGERLWARGLLRTWGVKVEVEGLDQLPPAGPYIIMANHQSHADVPILFSSLPIIPGFLAKKELGRIPFLAMALRAGGHVLIDRGDRSSAMRALKIAAEEIRSGKTLAIFPEGTRGCEDRLGPFKKGGFLVAKKAGVPVVPVGIVGSRKVLARDAWFPRSGSVRLVAGKPIAPEELRKLDVQDLSDRVYESIAGLLGWPTTPQREVPADSAPSSTEAAPDARTNARPT
jgi:1-acyl-sn-glycerol-3-phosphate acyltransferase